MAAPRGQGKADSKTGSKADRKGGPPVATPRSGHRPGRRRWGRLFLGLALGAMLAPILLIALYAVVPPPSTLMLWRWATLQGAQRDWVPLERISPHLVRAVIAAEDARFCQHGGVDWDALREVIETSDEDGPARGASTLTMQTAKNLFLWHGRSYLRKGLELPLAALLDTMWSKRRVLEVYLNIAEWGEGTFGAQAGARRAFGKSAAELTAREAGLMAVALPNPLRRDLARPSRALQARNAWLAGRLLREDIDLSCLGPLGSRRAGHETISPAAILPETISRTHRPARANPDGQG